MQVEDKSFVQRVAHKVVRGLQQVSRMWLSHFILMGLLILYTVAGGFAFLAIEKPADVENRIHVSHEFQIIIRNMWEQARNETMDEVMWIFDFRNHILQYSTTICKDKFFESVRQNQVLSQWTLTRAIYFSFMVYTTIGYGDVVPISESGRALTIVYALIGIPFFLVVISDLGNVAHQALKYGLFYLKKYYYGGKTSLTGKKLTRKSLSSAPCRKVSTFLRIIDVLCISYGSRPFTAKRQKHLILQNQLLAHRLTMENFKVPLTVVTFIMVSYVLFGALMFSISEDWEYFESFYFIMITLSTVGFGDFTPTAINEIPYIAYVTFGMIIVAMFIRVFILNLDMIRMNLKQLILYYKGHILEWLLKLPNWIKKVSKAKRMRSKLHKVTKRSPHVPPSSPLERAYAWSAPDESPDEMEL